MSDGTLKTVDKTIHIVYNVMQECEKLKKEIDQMRFDHSMEILHTSAKIVSLEGNLANANSNLDEAEKRLSSVDIKWRECKECACNELELKDTEIFKLKSQLRKLKKEINNGKKNI